MPGFKHLIECHCVLPIYKNVTQERIYHKFPVYSKIDKNDAVIPKLVKCNNCDTMHYVYDVCRSELRGGKDQSAITSDDDELSLMLPERLSKILKKLDTDISNWEHVIDIFDEKRWGEEVVLRREIVDEKQHVKILKVVSDQIFKIQNKSIEDLLKIGE